MKAFLMYQDQDIDLKQKLPSNQHELIQDLELATLFNVMASDDEFVYNVSKHAILSGFSHNPPAILYRQHILQDCLKNASIIREIYAIAVVAIEGERKHYWGMFSKYPASILSRSLEIMQMFVNQLKQLKQIADDRAEQFESEGFTRLLAMLRQELSDEYFNRVQEHLKELKFRDGVLISAVLGPGNKGSNYTLRQPHHLNQGWIKRIFGPKPPEFSFSIHPRDESGARALSELRDRGINLVANALARSTEHILSFFTMLRTELAFYVGCLNLYEQLAQLGEPLCFPDPVAAKERKHTVQGLYDVCLALTMQQKIVGNTVKADRKNLVIITGANQGGKSTFLRSIGAAQLMMQCGMFVPAKFFSANLCDSLFTHYKREEDTTMKSGKLDEELSRMSAIVDHLTPNAMVLFNESFAATNEREGSEIGRQIVSALLEKQIKVFFVTHLYEFAHGFYTKKMENALFLRAERQTDGTRTFQLVKSEPLPTSYGADVYQKIFRTEKPPRPGS